MNIKPNKAIKNPDSVCFKCLKKFKEGELYKIKIPELGYGSGFDNFSTKIHLCENCIRQTDLKWWKLEVEYFGENDWGEKYKYEKEIFNFIKTLPIEGQELFWNRYGNSNCSYYMEPQDWIDYELDLLPHEKCQKYGLYSPEERQAYQERFPICKNVKIKIYEDGSSSSRCIFGAFGNKDGTAKGHQIQSKCYNCIHFELREGEIITVDMKKEEIKRIKRQIKILNDKIKKMKE